MKKQVTYIFYQCDACELRSTPCLTKEVAKEIITDQGWKVINGKHYCADCSAEIESKSKVDYSKDKPYIIEQDSYSDYCDNCKNEIANNSK